MDLQETIDSEAKKKKILIILGIALLLIIIGVAVYFLTKPAKGTPTGTLSDFSGLESEERESTSSFALATTIALSADRTTVSPGQEAIISWTSANATNCVSTAGDEVKLEGAVSVSPNEPYTFEITCNGPNGTDIQSVTIDVTTAPIIELRASPSAVVPGETSTISWKTFNANRCVDSAGSTLLLTDNFQVNPKKTYTFEMSCTGANGETKKSVTVGMVSTCENGATNFPSCTTLPDGSCVNGNSNPPSCNAEMPKTCGNGATNFPSCTTLPGGSCVNGNSNPPSCNAEFFGSGNNNNNNKDFGKKGNVNAPKADAIPTITLSPNIRIPYDTTTLVTWKINNASYCIFTSDSPAIENVPFASSFEGYISGKTLTVTNTLNGSVLVGHTLHSGTPGGIPIPRGTTVVGKQNIIQNTYTLDVPVPNNSTYSFGSVATPVKMNSRGDAETGLFGLSPIVSASGSKTTSRMKETRTLKLACSNKDNVKVSRSMTIEVEPKPAVATTTIEWANYIASSDHHLYKGTYEPISLKWTAKYAISCALRTNRVASTTKDALAEITAYENKDASGFWTLPGKEALGPDTSTIIYIKDYKTNEGKSTYKLSCISTDTKQHPDPVESRVLTISVAPCGIVVNTVPWINSDGKQVPVDTTGAEAVTRGVVEADPNNLGAARCTYTYEATDWITFSELFDIPGRLNRDWNSQMFHGIARASLGAPTMITIFGGIISPSDPSVAPTYGATDLCKLTSYYVEDVGVPPVAVIDHYFNTKYHPEWEHISHGAGSSEISVHLAWQEQHGSLHSDTTEWEYWPARYVGVNKLKCLVKYPTPTTTP